MSPIPPAQIASLYRYPVKGLSPEPLPRVVLRAGETLPADRRYAIENGPSGFDPASPVWMPKSHFLMLMRDERLAGLRSHFEDNSNLLT
ncbi:MAG: MOSC domain-containing protein, partial [Alphaproteobacteria bacterium]